MNSLTMLTTAISALDDKTLRWLNQFMYRWPEFDAFVAWLLNASVVKFVPLLMAIVWLWFERAPKKYANRQILIEPVFISLAALVVGRGLALLLPFRDRPFVRPELHFETPLAPVLRNWSAFPSDHAMLAFALAASLFRISPRIGLWALFHATLFICLPRLYFGLHHPSDLMGGAIIGVAMVFFVSRWTLKHSISHYFICIERKHAVIFYTASFFVLYNMGEMFSSVRELANLTFYSLRHLMV